MVCTYLLIPVFSCGASLSPITPLSSESHHLPQPLCRLLPLSTYYAEVRTADISVNSDGRKERVQFDKITARVSRLCYGLDMEHVDAACITQKVISGVYQGVTTVELDNLVSNHILLAPSLATPATPLEIAYILTASAWTGCRDRRIYDSRAP